MLKACAHPPEQIVRPYYFLVWQIPCKISMFWHPREPAEPACINSAICQLTQARPWDKANLRQLEGSRILGRIVGANSFEETHTTDHTTNMMIPSFLGPTLLISWIPYFPVVHSSFCNGLLYGYPNVDDCEQALLEIPFAREGSSSRSQTPQLFAEPQFQSPPFHSITNNLRPQAIVQLPKIWKHSKSYAQIPPMLSSVYLIRTRTGLTPISDSCRIALVSQGVSESVVYRPVFTTRWQNIIDQSAELRSCYSFKPSKGGWTKVSSISLPHIYMTESATR